VAAGAASVKQNNASVPTRRSLRIRVVAALPRGGRQSAGEPSRTQPGRARGFDLCELRTGSFTRSARAQK
jgi:hypothetical protein